MDDKRVPVIFDYDFDMMVGYADIKEDGTAHFVLTDPRIVDAIKADRADLIRGLTLHRVAAVHKPFTNFTTHRDIPTGDFRDQ